MAYCTSCGQDTGDAKFCVHCGCNLHESDAPTEAVTASEVAAPIPPQEVPQSYAPPAENYQGSIPPQNTNIQGYAPQQNGNFQGYAQQPNNNYQGYNNPPPSYQPAYQGGYTPYPRNAQNAGTYSAAYIFMIIGTVLMGLSTLLIGLAWCIPMTLHAKKIKEGTKPNTVAFGVCCLLFVGLIAGILFLINDKEA